MRTLEFVETMRGSLGADGGAAHPVEFTVCARALGAGKFSLEGLARAGPWLPQGSARGTLTMSLFPPAVTYRLELEGGLVLEGKKDPRPWRPLRSMTWMPVALHGAKGELLATGTMEFDLRELPKFAASWLKPAPQRKRLEAERRRLVRAAWDG